MRCLAYYYFADLIVSCERTTLEVSLLSRHFFFTCPFSLCSTKKLFEKDNSKFKGAETKEATAFLVKEKGKNRTHRDKERRGRNVSAEMYDAPPGPVKIRQASPSYKYDRL